MNVVEAGHWVVMSDVASSHCRMVHVDPEKTEVVFGKKWEIPINVVVGLPYGSALTQDARGAWMRCKRLSVDDFVLNVQSALRAAGVGSGTVEDLGDDDPILEAGEDTPLVPTGQKGAQKLNAVDVISRKTEGVPLLDLIVELCRGSRGFAQRTTFSQEKYIRKKLTRHMLQLTVSRVNLLSIYQAYIGTSAGISGTAPLVTGRLGNWITPEAIGTILNEANVTHGQNVVVADQVTGLLTAAVMARMGPAGRVLFVSEFKGASSHISKQMNFNEATLGTYREVPYEILSAAARRGFDDPQLRDDWPLFFSGAKIEAKPDLPIHHQRRIADAIARRDQRLEARMDSWKVLGGREVDCFVAAITCSSFPCNDVRLINNTLGELYRVAETTLRAGGRLAIYHNNLQPLSDAFVYIKSRKNTWTDCRFLELCHREICTLPGRSHPQMDNSIKFSQGFILLATRMVDTELEPTKVMPEPTPAADLTTSAMPDNNPLAALPTQASV